MPALSRNSIFFSVHFLNPNPLSAMRLPPTPLLLAALLGLCQCKHTDPAPPKPEDQLPPATQTGANTFGCLLNGQPWLPTYGLTGLTGPFRVSYDPGYSGGSLQIRVHRIVSGLPDGQDFIIGGAPISKEGNYVIGNTAPCGVYYSTGLQSGPCQEYYNAPGLTMHGQLTITHLDMTKGIISGTFTFTLAQPGCDTLKVTQGRFDKQL